MRRAPRSSLPGLICVIAAGALVAPPAASRATQEQLRQAEQARAEQQAAQKDATARAAAAAAQEQRLTAERIAAAARLRQAEIATAEAAAKLDALAAKRQEAADRLAARAESLQPILPLIQRLSLFPAETMLAVPAPPEDRIRAVLVLQGLSRQIESDARALRRDQAALEAATRALQAELPEYEKVAAAQAAEAAALDRQIAAAQATRSKAEDEAEVAAKRVAASAMQADTIRQALAELEAQRKAEEARAKAEALRAERRKREAEAAAARQRQAALSRPSGEGTMSSKAQPKGQLVLPVTGRVVRDWGDRTEAGPASGLSYQAAPAARVVSPCGGRVVFADAFRSYGLLLIVDCGGGFHMVLAGLERLDTRAGQAVQAGEPVGAMPDWQPAGGGKRPVLYIELRKNGQPVNPAPWLRTSS